MDWARNLPKPIYLTHNKSGYLVGVSTLTSRGLWPKSSAIGENGVNRRECEVDIGVVRCDRVRIEEGGAGYGDAVRNR